MSDHDHGPRVVACAGCGKERWCGIGPCRRCGTVTPCPVPVRRVRVSTGSTGEGAAMSQDVGMNAAICATTKHEWAPHPASPGLAVCVVCGLLDRATPGSGSTGK